MRQLAILAATLISASVPARGADDLSSLDTLWTRARAEIIDSGGHHALAELGSACERAKRRSWIDTLRIAECQRWVGARQLALGLGAAAEASLTAAHRLYTESLGALNPLSGEVLHLMAEIYLERGDVRRARLAIDRALTIFPPVDQRGAERCQAVYAAAGLRELPKPCRGELSHLPSVPSALEHLKTRSDDRCPADSCAISYGAQPLPGERRHLGFFRDGVRSGYGLEITVDGSEIWTGSYRDGSINGHAVYLGVKDSSVTQYYAGGWKGGRRHGYGSYRYLNGSRYTGEFRDGFEHGSGELVLQTGGRYRGSFAGGKFEGKGMWILPGFLRSEGMWKGGIRRGRGVDRYLDGLLEYRGEFADDLPDGYGRVLVDGQEVWAGRANPDVGIGFGQVKLSDGGSYFGQLFDGSPEGFGFERTRDGSIITGIWADSQRAREWTTEDLTSTSPSSAGSRFSVLPGEWGWVLR